MYCIPTSFIDRNKLFGCGDVKGTSKIHRSMKLFQSYLNIMYHILFVVQCTTVSMSSNEIVFLIKKKELKKKNEKRTKYLCRTKTCDAILSSLV